MEIVLKLVQKDMKLIIHPKNVFNAMILIAFYSQLIHVIVPNVKKVIL